MPYNQLLLSLIGGYLFVTNFNRTKYSISRSSGQGLLLESALWGSLLLLPSLVVSKYLLGPFPVLRNIWLSVVPVNGLGTSALSLVLGYVLAHLSNLIFDDASQNEKSYEKYSDYVGLVCFRAMRSNKQISITLKSGKVYVGFVQSCNTAGRKDEMCSVCIQPSKSGYRKEGTHEMVFTTFYTDIINQVLEPIRLSTYALKKSSDRRSAVFRRARERRIKRLMNEAEAELVKFDVAVPLRDVVSVAIFEDDIYDQFNPPEDLV